ncbi:branched-chain amino acid ABC transporter substrate-binding protein [Methylobacterium dankookense]|uniref:Leucine-, isoleucine-, valine-, threonine-, and alanine-binding protein n=1 Tax=Methylobacterium dankookense TaxID=560405 RepID=A0A564FSS8_9HYPH|nr:branched-chain amino acid ABC transporter substrate-binding protein [Methylobacterium dankookense]GJD56724.1 Leucine-, isoleucine-, valine-, threonine-, and alanine-binding protein [Methylobacterium dankookense]VUF11199.1 Leucine-, isoleucine-, valine-, threonine-, and alanine-binding protein [Methylobacterium dankookense]
MRIVAALLALGGLWGAPAAAQAPAPVKIGLSAPLTGPDAPFGQGLRLGAEQAVADLNRAGGRRLVLVVADDAGDTKQALGVARRFAAEGVRLVVGPLQSSLVAATAPAYEEAGTVVIAPAATYPPLTARGLWNLFRLSPGDAQQAQTAGAWLAARFPEGVALVHDRSTFGRGLAEEVSRTLRARGLREAAFESLPRGSRDAADVAGRLKAAGARAVYFGGLAPEAALLARALREAGLTGPMVASDGILDPAFPATAGPAGEGTVMTLVPERRPPDPRGKAAPRTPEADLVAGVGYAAVEVLAQALAAQGNARVPDGRKLAEAVRAGSFRTAIGPVAFDAAGDPRPGAVALRVWKRMPDGRLDFAGNDAP